MSHSLPNEELCWEEGRKWGGIEGESMGEEGGEGVEREREKP